MYLENLDGKSYLVVVLNPRSNIKRHLLLKSSSKLKIYPLVQPPLRESLVDFNVKNSLQLVHSLLYISKLQLMGLAR